MLECIGMILFGQMVSISEAKMTRKDREKEMNDLESWITLQT